MHSGMVIGGLALGLIALALVDDKPSKMAKQGSPKQAPIPPANTGQHGNTTTPAQNPQNLAGGLRNEPSASTVASTVIKDVAALAGTGAGIGAAIGAGVGAVTLPVVGSVPGAAVGAGVGAAVGAVVGGVKGYLDTH